MEMLKEIKTFKLIQIREKTESSILLDLYVPKELIYFQGHFDEVAILPGVCQLDLAIFYAQNYFNIEKSDIVAVDQIKFTKIIKPETYITLALKLEGKRLFFKYVDSNNLNEVYAKAKITLRDKV